MVQVRELFHLQDLCGLRLLTGSGGIDRMAKSAVLYEHDRAGADENYDGMVVLSALEFACNEPELLKDTLLDVLRREPAALLLKSMYFPDLPVEVLREADDRGIPVFQFDETYIREALLQVSRLVRGKQRIIGHERDLELLMNGQLSPEEMQERVFRILPPDTAEYRIFAILPDRGEEDVDEKLFTLREANEEISGHWVFLQHSRAFLAVAFERQPEIEIEEERLDAILEQAGIHPEQLTLGIGNRYRNIHEFGYALSQAICAVRAGHIMERRVVHESDAGLYTYVFSMCNSPNVHIHSHNMLEVIREYDQKNHTSLEETCRAYVEANGSVVNAAKKLFQHPNTIRYRLASIRKLLNMTENEQFEQVLFVAFLIIIIEEREET